MPNNFSFNEYLVIDTTGSVGIGSTQPNSRLVVENNINGDVDVLIRNSYGGSNERSRVVFQTYPSLAGVAPSYISWSVNTFTMAYTAGRNNFGFHDFRTINGGSEQTRLVISNAGNIGIGSGTNITAKLLVSGSGVGGGSTAHFVNSSGTPLFFIRDDGNVGLGVSGSAVAARLHVNNGGIRISGDLSTTIVPIIELQGIRYDSNDRDYQLLGSGVNMDELFFNAYLADRTTRTTYAYNFNSTAGSNPTLRIDGNGRVGIGTTTNTNLLTVNQASNTTGVMSTTYGFMLSNQGTTRLSIGNDGTNSLIQSWSSNPLLINGQGNHILLGGAASGPNTAIGAASPLARLYVLGSTTTSTPTLLVRENQAMAANIAAFAVQNAATTNLLYVSGSGNVGIGTVAQSRLHVVIPTSSGASTPGFLIEGTGTGAQNWQLYPSTSQSLVLLRPGLRLAAFGNDGSFYAGGISGDAGTLASFTVDGTNDNIAVGIMPSPTITAARFFVTGSATAATPTMIVREGVVSPTGGALAFEVENSRGSTLFAVSGSGNVGVGTSNPSGRFEVIGTSGSLLLVTDVLSGSLFSVNDVTGLPIFEVFSDDTVVAGAVNSNALVVTGSRVGIGTNNPTARFHVGAGPDAPGAADTAMIVTNAGTTNLAVRDSSNNVELLNYVWSGGGLLGTYTSHSLYIRTANADRVTIDTSGNVGVAIAPNAAYKLHVNGSIAAWDGTNGRIVAIPSGGTAAGYVEWRTSAGTRLGYMGASSTDLPVVLENSANFSVTGGRVGIGTSTNLNSVLTVSSSISQSIDIQIGRAYAINNNNTGSINFVVPPGGGTRGTHDYGAIVVKGNSPSGVDNGGSAVFDLKVGGASTLSNDNSVFLRAEAIGGPGADMVSLYSRNTRGLVVSGSSAFVGIGTSIPSVTLHLRGDEFRQNSVTSFVSKHTFYDSTTELGYVGYNGGSDLNIWDKESFGNVNIGTANSTRVIVRFDGNVGIGTTLAFSERLLVKGSTADSSADALKVQNSNSTSLLYVRNDGLIQLKSDDVQLISYSANQNSKISFWNSGASYMGYVGFGGTTTLNIDNQASGPVSIKTNSTDRIWIDYSGNVGIGTAGPQNKVHLLGASNDTVSRANANLTVEGGGGNGIVVGTLSSSPYSTWLQSGFVSNFGTATYSISLNPLGGNVGIGMTNPDRPLVVRGGNPTIGIYNTTAGGSNLTIDAPTSAVPAQIDVAGAFALRLNTNSAERMRIDSSGNVGIGTNNPSSRLEVWGSSTASTPTMIVREGVASPTAGAAAFQVQNSAGSALFIVSGSGAGTVGIGITAGAVAPFTAGGYGWLVTNGSSGAVFSQAQNGSELFRIQSDGGAHTLLGLSSVPMLFKTVNVERMRISTTGTAAQTEVGIGTATLTSGRSLTTAADIDVYGVRVGRGGGANSSNTVVGSFAGVANNSSGENTAVGYYALNGNTTNANTAVGAYALTTVTGGDSNVAVGNVAMYDLTTGYNNVAVGSWAANGLTTPNSNTAVGAYSLTGVIVGSNNTAIGYSAIYGGASGNTAVGSNCLPGMSTSTRPSNNTAIGWQAGSNLTTGGDNVIIGAGTKVATNSNSNCIVIGSGSVGLGSNTTRIGNSLTTLTYLDGNVGIGTTTTVDASLKIARGTAVNGTAMLMGTTNHSHFNYSTTEDTYIRGGKNSSKVYINDSSGTSDVIIATGGGNVGIATATTSGRLHVWTSMYYGGNATGRPAAGNGTALVVETSTGLVRETSSSRKTKENIKPYVSGLPTILSLEPVNFNFIGDPTPSAGFIAEDFDELGLKEFVLKDSEGNPTAIRYGEISALLVNGIKELKTENDSLKSDNERLKTDIETLKSQVTSILATLNGN